MCEICQFFFSKDVGRTIQNSSWARYGMVPVSAGACLVSLAQCLSFLPRQLCAVRKGSKIKLRMGAGCLFVVFMG